RLCFGATRQILGGRRDFLRARPDRLRAGYDRQHGLLEFVDRRAAVLAQSLGLRGEGRLDELDEIAAREPSQALPQGLDGELILSSCLRLLRIARLALAFRRAPCRLGLGLEPRLRDGRLPKDEKRSAHFADLVLALNGWNLDAAVAP